MELKKTVNFSNFSWSAARSGLELEGSYANQRCIILGEL